MKKYEYWRVTEVKNRVIYYDCLNIAACISVVILHCNQMVHTWQPGKNWLFALLIEVLFYWAVPIFFMLTGATLMRYRDRYDTKTFLKKRAKRTVVPFIAWSLIWYLLISVRSGEAHLGPRNFIDMMLNNQIEQVYWFFFPLFSIYLSMPLLSLLADNKRALAYGVGVSFILQSVLPYALPILGINWPGSIAVLALSGNLLFTALGYLLSTTELTKKQRAAIYVLGLLATIFRFAYTAVSSESIGAVDRLYFNYLAFPAVLQGVAVFTLFKHLDFSLIDTKKTRIISVISSCSFGVYLIHKPILDHFVLSPHWLNIPMTSVMLRTIGALVFYIACVGMVLLLKKIPVVKSIVP